MEVKVHALSRNFTGQVNCITTPIRVCDILSISGKCLDTYAIWDTGATNSVITEHLAHKLGLQPIGQTIVNGISGPLPTNVFKVNITLNNQEISLDLKVTECKQLSADDKIEALIGMDIIQQGDFAITNYYGNTTMSFRVPSIQKIDFVSGIRKGIPVINDKLPGRNAPCSCGSGKKFKHCCGK